MTRTRLHFHHALYQWWGVPSRYVQLVQHLDPARFACTTQGAADVADPEAMPDWQRQLAGLIAPDLQRQAHLWHNLNDLATEAATHDLCSAGGVDVVHFLDGEHAGPGLARMIRNRLAGVRSVATFHQPPALAEQVIRGAALRHLDAVVLMAPSQLPFFSRFVPPERLHVILHGVDTAFFSPHPGPRAPGPLRCITSGLHLRDWDAFHAVARARPEVAFTVVTSGRVTLQPLPNVQVLSGIPDADLAAAYRGADVLFLPLQDATANNSLLEGMASGLPILSTDLPAVRAYVPDAAGFLIPGNAVQPLCAALDRLEQDPALRARMGAAARMRAQDLAWAVVARQYEALYDRCLAEPRAVAHSDAAPLPALRRKPGIAPPPQTSPAPRLAGEFTALAEWGEALREFGLPQEAAMIVAGLAQHAPGSAASAYALAAEAEAEWRWDDAARHWDRALRSVGQDQRNRMLARKAEAQAQAGALALARASLAAEGKSFDTRLAAARIATAFSTAPEALAAWEACTTAFPDRIDGFIGLARLCLRQARFDAAEALLDHQRQVWPESAVLAALWAQVADDRGDLSLAERRWAKVLARHGSAKTPVAPYARHLGLTRDPADCLAGLADWQLDPEEWAEALLNAYTVAGHWALAAEQARLRARLAPNDLTLRLRLAELLDRVGTAPARTEALGLLTDLRDHAPDAPALLVPLARALIAHGQPTQAAQLIAQIPAEWTAPAAELARLWLALWHKGDTAALNHWQAVTLGFGLPGVDLD